MKDQPRERLLSTRRVATSWNASGSPRAVRACMTSVFVGHKVSSRHRRVDESVWRTTVQYHNAAVHRKHHQIDEKNGKRCVCARRLYFSRRLCVVHCGSPGTKAAGRRIRGRTRIARTRGTSCQGSHATKRKAALCSAPRGSKKKFDTPCRCGKTTTRPTTSNVTSRWKEGNLENTVTNHHRRKPVQGSG